MTKRIIWKHKKPTIIYGKGSQGYGRFKRGTGFLDVIKTEGDKANRVYIRFGFRIGKNTYHTDISAILLKNCLTIREKISPIRKDNADRYEYRPKVLG